MLEILAAYLFIKCYVSFDASKTSFWGYDARRSDRSTEQCLADFKLEVEKAKASPTGQRALSYWQAAKARLSSSFDQAKVEQAARLTRADLDRVLATVRQNVANMR
jgi:hypothetical protein